LKDNTYTKPTMVALHRIGEGCIPYLIPLLQHKKWQMRCYALQVLGGFRSIDDATIQGMLTLANDTRAPVRVALAWAIGQLRTPLGLPTLLLLIEDANLEVRQNALKGLAKLGEHTKAAIPKLMEVLASDSNELKGLALVALGATHDPTLIPSIQPYLESTQCKLRLYSMVALWELNALSLSYVHEITDFIGRANHYTAEKLLRKMGVAALPYILNGTVEDYFVDKGLKPIIQEFGISALPILISTLETSSNPHVRRFVAEILRDYFRSNDPGLIRALVMALGDSDWKVREIALLGLATTRIDLLKPYTGTIQTLLAQHSCLTEAWRQMLILKLTKE
jgi:hypothetical protein